MAIDQTYIPAPQTAIASYDFQQIAGATGSQQFFPFVADASGSFLYALEANAIDTFDISGSPLSTTNSGRWTLIGSDTPEANKITFQTAALNLPRTINGRVYAAYTIAVNNTGVSNQNIYVVVKVLRNNEVLAQSQSSTFTVTNGNSRIRTITQAITVPKNKLVNGDQIGISFHAVHSASTACTTRLYHDPDNNNDSTNTPNVTATTNHTDMTLYVPFDIDL